MSDKPLFEVLTRAQALRAAIANFKVNDSYVPYQNHLMMAIQHIERRDFKRALKRMNEFRKNFIFIHRPSGFNQISAEFTALESAIKSHLKP